MDLGRLPTWTEGGFHVVVESPRGSTLLKVKYEPEPRAFVGQRPPPLGHAYPYDRGFVPNTKAPDGDPVDALVCVYTGTFRASPGSSCAAARSACSSSSRPRVPIVEAGRS